MLIALVVILNVNPLPPLPPRAEVFFKQGNEKYAAKDYPGAIVDFTKAIELNPTYANAFYTRGLAYLAQEQHDLVIVDFTKAIELDPIFANAVTYYLRGTARAVMTDKQGAIADYQKAADLYEQQGETSDQQNALDQIKKLRQ